LLDHPELRVTQASEFPVILAGTLQVEGPAGLVDAYEVKIEFSQHFPLVPPVVFETGARLPRDIDRHVYADGHVCLEVWPVWRAKNPDATVRTVLNGPVRNFFLSQSVFEHSGVWPFGEYRHGDAGQREALRDMLRADSIEDKDLLWRANGLANPPRRQNTCPCGSRKLYRKCHRTELRSIAETVDVSGLWLITDMYVRILEREG
jgi:hypothetical protein